jgi:hypothetical protein
VRTAARRTPLLDTRTAQIPPQRRPHYPVHERMAILELRAARGWSLKQTADTFLVTNDTKYTRQLLDLITDLQAVDTDLFIY